MLWGNPGADFGEFPDKLPPERPGRLIGVTALGRAHGWCEYLEQHARRIYRDLDRDVTAPIPMT